MLVLIFAMCSADFTCGNGFTDKRDCRASALKEKLYRDVNDAVQKAFTVLRGNIWRNTEFTTCINPQMTRTK